MCPATRKGPGWHGGELREDNELSELALEQVKASIGPVGPKGQQSGEVFYRAKGADTEIHVSPCREETARGILGRIRSRRNSDAAYAALTVELMDQLGVVTTASPCSEGTFRFDGLSSGVYHLRISDGDWKIGVFGLTV